MVQLIFCYIQVLYLLFLRQKYVSDHLIERLGEAHECLRYIQVLKRVLFREYLRKFVHHEVRLYGDVGYL